jgi:predicted RND superfamily exporter protein
MVITTPPVHGSARFLLSPAPADTLEYVLRSQGLAVPGVLRDIAGLEEFVRGQSQFAVGGVLGPPDYIAAAEFLTSNRAAGSRRIPKNQDQVRWLWRSLGEVLGNERRGEIVNPTMERGLVTIFLGNANYVDTARLMKALREYERVHLAPRRIQLEFAGDVAVSQALIEAIVRSQVGSLLGSLLGIVAVSALVFRSLRWGMFCAVPAALAVAATFAMMGLIGMPLGVATSMFASMVLGIGVDFAIHMVQRYRSTTGRGAPHEDAVVDALGVTGPPIFINFLAIALGFGVLGLSQVPANAHLGGITVVSLTCCLIATVLVVPTLLRVAAPRGRMH